MLFHSKQIRVCFCDENESFSSLREGVNDREQNDVLSSDHLQYAEHLNAFKRILTIV